MKKSEKTVRENMLSVLPKMSKSDDYYSIREIFMRNALYNMIYGERSNGKTYSVLEFALWCYVLFGYELAIIRRYDLDFKGKAGGQMFKNHIENNLITKITKGQWTSVYYFSSRWYLCKYDDNKNRIVDENPFAYAFALSGQEHDKSTAYPRVKIILFDEFLTRTTYLQDEFVLLTNTISTIVRRRGDAVIFMCGNTVNQFCPYFSEMGLTNVRKMKQGTIDIYNYGNSELTVAVEYCGTKEGQERKKKDSDKYFAFDNPKLNMIKTGAWEMAIYPHLPMKYDKKDILLTYFIKFNEFTLQCEIIQIDRNFFTYIHRKSTTLQEKQTDLIFSPDFNPSFNYRRRLTKPVDEIGKRIHWFFSNDKVFYQDNEIGEIVRNYLIWSKTDRGFA